jgi:hypothetical protein
MADYPYTQNGKNLQKFLLHIQNAGVPTKVTQKYLEQIGFRGKNDRRIIGVMKSLFFIDSTGTPTEKWSTYRDKANAPYFMKEAIQSTYSDLFTTYPDAQNRDEEALRNYFSVSTGLGAKAVSLIVATFRSLCELADFEQSTSGTPKLITPKPQPVPGIAAQPHPITTKAVTGSGTNVNINIELTIPATDKPEVYENFFAAMKKHLLTDE